MDLPITNLLQKLVLMFTITLLAACASTSEPVEPVPEPEPVVLEPVIEEPVALAPAPIEPEIPAPPMPKAMINFAFDSADLSDEEMADLQQWAAWLSDSGIDAVEIHGHADEIGTEQYNQELSARRAQVTAAILRDLVGNELMTKEYAHGEQKPLIMDNDEMSRQQNRRVEIALPQMDSRVDESTGPLTPAATGRDS